MKKTLSSLFIVMALLAGFVQPVLAANSYDLNIHNNTEDTVKINLTGPKNYSVTFEPGKWTKTVVEGTYEYNYTVCGTKFSGEITITDDEQWLIVEPCGAVAEYAKFVVSSHLPQSLTLTLTGPETYALAIELGQNKFLSIQTGIYSYSYDACGTTITSTIRVPKNGTGNLIVYACEQMANHAPQTDSGLVAPSNLRIGSHYGFPVRMTLLSRGGGANYSFELTTGLNRLNVIKGTYDFYYLAYGSYRTGTVIVGENGASFIISPLR
jgi:hypothetical protein